MSLRNAAEIQAMVEWRLHERERERGTLTLRRGADRLPAEPLVKVEALRDNWLMHGRPVEVGAVYTLPKTEAAVLEFTGKAKIIE